MPFKSRVYGCALLVGGYTPEEGFDLYYLNPSGSCVSYFAKSIGSGSTTADLDLKNAYKEDMSLEEATRVVCASLKAVMEEEISVRNIEFAMITERGIESLGDDRKQSLISSIS